MERMHALSKHVGCIEVRGGENWHQTAFLISLVIENSMIQNGASLTVDNLTDWISVGIGWWVAK